ncbi:hypothetical protein SXYLSMQ121_0041 [Staphylococcus xylosus]|uniref:Uncharacterized protein n=1 Tax=Staphylococcus xylosus TaxID=1288 RepID=K8DVG2_STAXY|nr:hypothetical protein SXYLSMQ121_0041 [Staphylococcus xylosus]CCM44192.1 hypothetical protein [Staphylococcus xylosus]
MSAISGRSLLFIAGLGILGSYFKRTFIIKGIMNKEIVTAKHLN